MDDIENRRNDMPNLSDFLKVGSNIFRIMYTVVTAEGNNTGGNTILGNMDGSNYKPLEVLYWIEKDLNRRQKDSENEIVYYRYVININRDTTVFTVAGCTLDFLGTNTSVHTLPM